MSEKNTPAKTQSFGTTTAGLPVEKITLTNRHGNRVTVMNWGASLLEVEVPDRDGNLANVNLVFDSIDRYLKPHPGFGSSIGRFCNRIGHAKFEVDGVEYNVTKNHGEHCLHGGDNNFSHKLWGTELLADDAEKGQGVRYTLVSPDGDEGFPGEITVTTEYRWNDANELVIEYGATTSAPTHVNLTNHAYWNLGGVGSGPALNHVAVIHASEILDVDEDLIPTGKIGSVKDTPFDFLTAETFAKRIDQLPETKGYDHCYVVDGPAGMLRKAARVADPSTGRVLEIESTQPAMQLYTANHLSGDEHTAGHAGHDAFCLETQHHPNAPNRPGFPSTLLRPSGAFRETTVHRFLVD
ncbi:aldose 1-epimerase [Neorhodopirellula lusitana]|uniref:Aldose 1-epimerase n=1 Tax=Neorhodopirellula lusitana TaxID=445327 RepID=A0ABY1Q764_9BACT|nr:aldose epimerase family protein [Neorhodopirellula lusitana]SMP61865.1 aldose 1-epimerase [Neorhodopirellula lusitana]